MSFGWIPLTTIRDPPFRTNLPVTLMMKESPETPLSVTVLPLRTTSPTQTTVGAAPPPVALMVVALEMLLRVIVHGRLAASAHGVLFDANRCVCTHTPRVESVALTSHPAVVHVLPSVSPHGVLAGCGVHFPVVVSHPLLH